MSKQYLKPAIIILIALVLLGFALHQVKQVAVKHENKVADLLRAKDASMMRLDESKVLNRQISSDNANVVAFLKRWEPALEISSDTNEIIRGIEMLAVNRKAISLSPKVGQTEDVYIGGEPMKVTPFVFTFIAESSKSLHRLVFDIQQEYKAMRVTSVSIKGENDALHMQMEISMPTKGAM